MSRPAYSRDELAVLAAIHADPRSDLPRLVYADWLDDHSQPEYAAFIRLSCRARDPVSWRQPARGWHARRMAELAKATREEERVRLRELDARWQAELAARDLLVAHGKAWAKPLPAGLKLREYARGLPRAEVTPAGLAADAAVVETMSPRLRLTVTLTAAELDRHLDGPLVGRADDLFVLAGPDAPLGEAVVRRLAACPHLATLERLLLRPLSYDAMAASRELLEPRVDVRAMIAS